MDVRSDPVVIIPTIFANPDLYSACTDACLATLPFPVPWWFVDGGTFAENCNRGAEKYVGDPMVFLNDDTVPQPGWLEALVAPFEDPRVGITGARLTYPDGRIQHAGVGFRDNGGLEAFNILEDGPSREVEAVTGACMAVSRACWDELGGFDIGFRNGYEDVDFCLRARAAGWRIWYCADSHVIHHESQSGAARWSHVRENVQRLQERHGHNFGL